MIRENVTFGIPDEYAEQMAEGLVNFSAGVLRGKDGKIVKHVLPIDEISSGTMNTLGISSQLCMTLGLGVAIAAATMVICYEVNKAKKEIIEHLDIIHKDIKDIQNKNDAMFFGTIYSAIIEVNQGIPKNPSLSSRNNEISIVRNTLNEYMQALPLYMDKMLKCPDIRDSQWLQLFFNILRLYLFTADALLKVELELGIYARATDVIDGSVFRQKLIWKQFDDICSNDLEFAALGMSMEQRQEIEVLKNGFDVLDNRRALITIMQENQMVMDDIRELSTQANGEEVMLLTV